MNAKIAYCKIFPPIGIARVGNSRHDFFIAPDGVDSHPPTRYKDPHGAIIRQAARFRVYAFSAEDEVIGELTAHEAVITWKVALANKKAEWFAYDGTEKALAQFDEPEAKKWARRNPDIRDPEERRRLLVIDPGKPVSVAGPNKADRGTLAFVGKFQDARDVYLGELQTDSAGRLLVLGGHGVSMAVNGQGADISQEQWITNYANNDLWHDDTSDGPVTCSVKIDGKAIDVRGQAWVLVTPPDFAPAVENLVTLFDVMEEVALRAKLPHPGLPAPRAPKGIQFWQDIHPILARVDNYSWVSDQALRGHAKGKDGDFSARPLLGKLANPDPDNEECSQLRRMIFARIRAPEGERTEETAAAQANGHFMPALSGDEGDTTTGDPTTWLTVTRLQYLRLKAWADGDFVPGEEHPEVSTSVSDEPGIITRTVLAACAGGAFYPGIEMTSIARKPELYAEAYRLKQKLEPGDVSKYMACPWQADFYECMRHWWPAQRPDSVITARTTAELRHAFPYERKQGMLQNLMLVREPWARGVETPRPTLSSLTNFLFPAPGKRERIDNYIKHIAGKVASVLDGLANVATRVDESLANRVPGLGRVQFLIQEQFDVYSGRFFHFRVPDPDEYLAGEGGKELASKLARTAKRKPQGATAQELERQVQAYINFISARLLDYITEVLEALKGGVSTAEDFHQIWQGIATKAGGLGSTTEQLENNYPRDFQAKSPEFFALRFVDMAVCAIDCLYLSWTQQSGDNGMVKEWSKLGFVVERELPSDEMSRVPAEKANVETERSRLEGLQFRDYYYMLCNIDQYPEMYQYSSVLVEKILAETRTLIDKELDVTVDKVHILEVYFDYDPSTFSAKLEEIYEAFREDGVTTKPWEQDLCADDLAAGFVSKAPFNQNDGAWLRFVANAGTSDEERGLLFDVWSDEFGNGDPALQHSNLYTTFLRGINVFLPEVTSREYADYPGFTDDLFPGPVLELAISQNSDRYFPEILGMTLQLEWEVLSLVPGIKIYDYHGFNSQFWRMHVGIDNAVDGHGAKARAAIELYLDKVLRESGHEAMQREWKRIWTGFVAFATAGYNYMGNGSDNAVRARRPDAIYAQMVAMLARKQHYGSMNHGGRMLGPNRINDWFDDPDGFLDELANSPWIEAGNPEASRLLTYLTTFNGPMFEVFNAKDLALWRKWISWLGRAGDTSAVKSFHTKAESMLLLLGELRGSLTGTDGHLRFRLKDKSLHDWFSGDLVEFMRALGESDSPWVVKYDAGNSPLVRDFAAGTNRMARALDRRFPRLGNQVGRLVIVRWINAGCPIPGEATPDVPTRRRSSAPRPVSIMALYGIGAVH